MEIIKHSTPEQQELEKKLTELKALEVELCERELELATLRAELVDFERRYVGTLGPLYAELDEIEAQIAEATARFKSDDPAAQKVAAEARAQADQSARVAKEREHDADRPEFHASPTLKKLYRDAAMAMHPDRADNDDDRARRHTFMSRANAAYEAGDEQQLRTILREWHSNPERVQGDGPGAELVRTIRKIARCADRLQAIRAEINELQQSDLAALKTKVAEAAKQGRDLVAEIVSMTPPVFKRISNNSSSSAPPRSHPLCSVKWTRRPVPFSLPAIDQS